VPPERARHLPWKVGMTLCVGVVGPPVASLILMTTIYLPLVATRAGPIDLPGLMALFILFAVPVGYVFGVVPALLTGAMYSGVLTAVAPRRTGMLPRACLAAVCGGLVGGIWFRVVAWPDWHCYAAVAGLVAGLLSLRWPRAITLRTNAISLRLSEHRLNATAPEPRLRPSVQTR
jgi:hypothetical protein